MQVLHCYMCTLPHMLHVLNIVVKYHRRSAVKQHTTAVYSHHRTVIHPEFWSTALLRYGGHPYNTVFRTAITVYGMVESPSQFPEGEHVFPVPNFRLYQGLIHSKSHRD